MKRSRILAVTLLSVTALGAAVAIPALAHGPQGGGWMQETRGGPGAMMGSGQWGPGMMSGPGDHGMGPGGPGAMGGRMAGPWDDDDRTPGQRGPGMMRGMGPGMMGDPEVMEHMMEMHAQFGGMGGPGMMSGPGGFGMMAGPGGAGMMGGLFGNLDADGNGIVTSDEARDGMQAALKQYDANGDGSLSLDEFQALYDNAIRPQMVDRFQAFDADGDGQVTGEEIAAPADRMQRMQAMHDSFFSSPDAEDNTAPEGN